MRLTFTYKEFLAVLAILGVLAFIFYPVFAGSPYKAREISCLSNLKQIGQDIQKYRAGHQGKMPPDTIALTKSLSSTSVLVCPVNWSSHYLFRPSKNSNAVICWDGAPHTSHIAFWKEAVMKRNVLFGNGTVKRMDEDDFQKLNLKGTPMLSVNPTK